MNKIVSVIAAIFIGWALSFSAALFADSEDGYTHSPTWSGAISQNDNKLYINKEDGSVHFSYDIGTLQAKGMSIPLALRYDSGTKVDLSGLGTNWSIHGLPTIVEYVPSSPTSSDPVTFTLYPGDGSSYSLLSSTNADGSLQYAAQPDKGAFEGIRVYYCPSFCTVTPEYGPKTTYMYKMVDTYSGLTYYLMYADQAPLVYNTSDGAKYSNRYIQPALITNTSGSYITASYKSAAGTENLSQYGNITLTTDTGALYTMNLDFDNWQINIDTPSYRRVTVTYGYIPFSSGSGSKATYPHDSTARNYPDSVITKITDKDLIANKHYVTSFSYQPYKTSSNLINGKTSISSDSSQLFYYTYSIHGYTTGNSPLWYASETTQPFINAAASQPAKQPDTKSYPNEPSFSWGASILSGIQYPSGKDADIRFLSSTVYDDSKELNINGLPQCRDDEQNGEHHCGIFSYHSDYHAGAIFAVPYATNIDYSYTDANNNVQILKGEGTLPAFNAAIPTSSSYNHAAPTHLDLMHNYTAFPYVAGQRYSTQDAQWQMLSRYKSGIDGGAAGYGEAADQYLYQYSYNSYNYYTKDHVLETYTAPHLPTLHQSNRATGDTIKTTKLYDNLDYTGGYLDDLNEQPKPHDMPSKITTNVTNGATFPSYSLQRVTAKTYTYFGDIRSTTLANGTTTVHYYNYDDTNVSETYRHLTATVILPDTTRATDASQLPTNTEPAYAYFSKFTLDPATNLISAGEEGYIPCKVDSNKKVLQTCFDLDTIGQYEFVQTSDLYKDIFSTSPPDKTGFISKQLLSYDDYGRLKTSDYYPSPETAPTLAAISLNKQYFDDYNSLTAEGIDILQLPSYLTSNNDADNPLWYVLSTVTNKADPNGSWSKDTRTHKTLDIISQHTGKTLATFSGYDQENKAFMNGKAVSYNAYLIMQQALDINRNRAVDYSYTMGKGNNQNTLTQYYCDKLNSPDAVASIDYLSSENCKPVRKAITLMDDMQRKTSLANYQSSDGTTWSGEQDKVAYSYNDSAGGVIASEEFWNQGQLITQTTPIYDASHTAIGEMTHALPTNSANEASYSSKVYDLSFQDNVANRSISFKLFPCSGHSSTSTYCTKTLTIVQKERIGTGVKDGSNRSIQDAKGSRIISVSNYRFNAKTAGYPMVNLPTFMETLSNTGAASNTQQIINGILYDLGLGNATGDSPERTGVIPNSNWTLTGQENYFYDIYNRATRINILAKDTNTNKWKQRVMLSNYDVKNRLIKSSNADTNSSVNTGDGGKWSTPSGYSTQVNNNDVLLNADIISTSFRYNDMNQITGAILYQDTLDASKTITPESSSFFRAKNYLYDSHGKLRSLINCGGANYPEGGCQSNPSGFQTFFSAQSADANNIDSAYDGLGRLLQWKDASNNTHRKSYFDTQQLKATWVVNNADSALPTTKPICYAYNFSYNWKIASYFADTVSDLATTADCAYSNDVDINSVDATTRASSKMITLVFDVADNHLLQKVFPDGSSIINTYFDNGLLASKKDIKGFTTNYSYFSNSGLLASASTIDPSSNSVLASVSYGYDNENRVNTQSYGSDGDKIYTREINENNANISLVRSWKNAGNPVSQSTQVWDYAGTMASITRQDYSGASGNIQYTYDALNRISDNTATSQANEYDYDASGNLTNQGLNRDELDEINTTGYSYDVASNLTTDPKGKYVYNNRNQLVVFIPAGSSTTWTYSYDSQGHIRTRSANDETLVYYWRGFSLDTIKKQSGESTTLGYSHNFLKMTGHFTSDVDGKYQENLQYLVKGLNNNVLGTFSDTKLATYSPYGKLTNGTSSLTDSSSIFDLTKIPWGYKGGLSLPEIGADTLFFKRIYDADIRSFTQSDPDQRDFNRSKAFNADPIAYNDPTGLFGWHALGHKIGHNIKMGYHKSKHGIAIGLVDMQVDPLITPMIAAFLGSIVDTVEGGGENYAKEMELLAHPHFDKAGWYKKIINTPIKPVAMRIYNGFKGLVVANIQAFKTGNWMLAVKAGFMDGFFIVSFGESAGVMDGAMEELETETVAEESASENEERSDQPRSRRGAMDKDAEDAQKAKQEKPASQRIADTAKKKVLGKLKFWQPHPMSSLSERSNEIWTTQGHPEKYQPDQ